MDYRFSSSNNNSLNTNQTIRKTRTNHNPYYAQSLPVRSSPFHRNAMGENSGLSRRRVNTGPASSPSEPSSSLFASHAGSAFAGGNKIAFDPRDLEQDEEESKTGGKVPRLTLMEEVLLLGLKDNQASLSTT